MENPAILLCRLNPYCACAIEGEASLCQTRAHAEILPDTGTRNVDRLLNQQILSVLSQPLLAHMTAKQKPQSLTPGWSDEKGISLDFNQTEGENA